VASLKFTFLPPGIQFNYVNTTIDVQRLGRGGRKGEKP